MKRICVAGSLIADTVKLIDKYPRKHMLAQVREAEKSLGGCVPNVAVDLKRLCSSFEIAAYGRVGEDSNGRFLLSGMEAEGVDVSHVKRDGRAVTSFTDVMTEEGGARTFFHHRGANDFFCEEDVDLPSLECDLFHAGYALLLAGLDEADDEYGTRLARLLHGVRARGIKTSLDAVSECSPRVPKIIGAAAKECDLLILNEIEAGQAVGISARDGDGKIVLSRVEEILEAMVALGVREKAVLHCPELGASMRRGQRPVIVPSLRVPKERIKGTVGAGDAFCAGVLFAELSDADDEEALRVASCAAAANLAVADSVSGGLPLRETMKLESEFGRNLL